MASMGLKYLAWAKMATEPAAAVPTYDAGVVLGKAVSTGLTVTNAEGELYADDLLAEYVSEFSSAALTAEADNVTLENQAKLYGAAYADGEIKFSSEDTAPYGGIGGYQVIMVGGVKKFRAWFFPKGRASIPDWAGATKGSSISFGTQPIRIKVMAPNYGPWYYVKEFDSESAAKAYIDAKLGVATWYTVEVQRQGSGTVSPIGKTSVAAGGSLVINVSGSPTKLYDNGTDKTSSIASNKYTISTISADHAVAVIYGS